MQVNSWHGTIVVAFLLCLVCSLIVSFTADTLKEERKANVELDVKRNLLLSAGLITGKKASPDEIEEKFKNVEIKVVDLDTGQPVPSSQLSNPSTFDARKAAKDPARNIQIPADLDLGKNKQRAKWATCLLYTSDAADE